MTTIDEREELRAELGLGSNETLVSTADMWSTPIGRDGTPYAYIEALRDELEESRIGWSEAWGGYWVVGGYDEAVSIYSRPEAFTNEQVSLPQYERQGQRLVMGEHDEPEHKRYRTLVAASFSPKQVASYDEHLRKLTNDLIDGFIADGRADVAETLARQVPALLTTLLLGLPPEMASDCRLWADGVSHIQAEDPERAKQITGRMVDFAYEYIERRRREPGDDIISMLVNEARVEEEGGRPLTDDEVRGYFQIFLIGGIDNSTRWLATSLWRLAWDKDLRRRLIEQPGIWNSALDELMRYYGPAMVGRRVKERITIGDVTMEPGQFAMLWAAIENRDRKAFPYADTLIPERTPNKHLSLGNGIHRCIGMHLARTENRAVLSEFLRRVPEFELAPGEECVWTTGQVAGFAHVPVVFPAGTPEG